MSAELKRSTWGVKRRAGYAAEADQARIFEQLLLLHGLEWWHPYFSARSKSGWPDYVIFGSGWHAFVEIKARNPISGRKGKLSEEQRRFARLIEGAAGEWLTFCFPDDWHDVDVWLNAHTGLGIWGAAR